MAVSQMSAVQCRLAPLIQVIQDCSHLYHYAVKLMFKLHSCESRGRAPRWSFPRLGVGLAWRDAAVAMSMYSNRAVRTCSIPRRHPR